MVMDVLSLRMNSAALGFANLSESNLNRRAHFASI